MTIEKFIKCRVVSSLDYWVEKLQNQNIEFISEVIYDLERKLILRLCRKEKKIGVI